MATTTVSDYVIWTKHIHDDPVLAARLSAMRAGDTIDLDVDGVHGTWRKMDDGKDGRPTAGLRPIGSAQEAWSDLFKRCRGQVVRLAAREELVAGVSEGASPLYRGGLATFLRTDAERQAALAALLDGARQGSRSEAMSLSRDEMHER
jgi:hypothetical protein